MAEFSNPLLEDLDQILENTNGLWEDLRGSRIFVTGGTGFVGCWMLESLLHATDMLGLGASVVVLSRNPGRFAQRLPHLARSAAFSLVEGDICSFAFPDGPFTHVLHMAAETNTSLANPSPSVYFETSVDGTRRVLEFAASAGVRQLLLTSSGAVYGPQPPACERLSENQTIAPSPENIDTAYGQGKRAAEFLCCAAHAETGLEAKIARCFAFVGPYLPLDSGFAIGNFIRDALNGDVIEVTGDGTPRRSYLYAADLTFWLWTILLRGESARPYNVGAEREVSIAELARVVAQAVSGSGVEIGQEPMPAALPARYVPDTSRAADELGLHVTVPLEEAIRRTVAWHRTNQLRHTEMNR